MGNEYTASSIEIRDHSVDIWSSAIALSEKYERSVEWIEAGLLACELCGIGHDYFIRRYLDDDKTIPLNHDVNKISAEAQKQRRNKVWEKAGSAW